MASPFPTHTKRTCVTEDEDLLCSLLLLSSVCSCSAASRAVSMANIRSDCVTESLYVTLTLKQCYTDQTAKRSFTLVLNIFIQRWTCDQYTSWWSDGDSFPAALYRKFDAALSSVRIKKRKLMTRSAVHWRLASVFLQSAVSGLTSCLWHLTDHVFYSSDKTSSLSWSWRYKPC